MPHSSLSDISDLNGLAARARLLTRAVYTTRPRPPGQESVDSALFASPSAVTGWLSARSLADVVIGAIGETTAKALFDAGHPPDVVPDDPDFEELIALLARHLRGRSPV